MKKNINLKIEIIRNGMTQQSLAYKLGIQESRLSKIINGWIEPNEDMKDKISYTLKTSKTYLFPKQEETS